MASIFRFKNSAVWWIKYKDPRTKKIIRNPLCDEFGNKIRSKATAKYKLYTLEKELAESALPTALRQIPFDRAYREYLQYCEASKTRKTVRTDRYYLDGYFKTHTRPEFLHGFDVHEFQAHIIKRVNDNEIEDVSANGWIRAFRTFFSWTVDKEYLDRNPLARVKDFSIPKPSADYLSMDEISKLLTTAAPHPKKQAMIATTIYAGLRREELIFLDWKDINFHTEKIRIINKQGFTTKSKKPRTTPLHPELKNILEPLRQPSGPCFGIKDPLGCLKTICKSAKLSCNLKLLRHTFGAYCALSGVPIPVIKEWMGHEDIETTMIYARLKQDAGDKLIRQVSFGQSFGQSAASHPSP